MDVGDDDTATPLFLFGEAMLDLLVCHGTAFALESGIGGGRFAIFARLNRVGLITALSGHERGFWRKSQQHQQLLKNRAFGTNLSP